MKKRKQVLVVIIDNELQFKCVHEDPHTLYNNPVGIMFDAQSSPRQNEHGEEIEEEMTTHATIDGRERVPMIDGIDRGRLLFLVFSILKKLGGDERPEVWFLFQ